jgi:hypothetical protein
MKTGISVLAVALLSSLVVPISIVAAAEKETRALSDFDAIEVGGAIDLQLLQGQSFVVEVESGDGPASRIVTEVHDGTLRLRHEWSRFPDFTHSPPHRDIVRVTLPKLVALKASGASDVSSKGTVKGDSFRLEASGGADVTLDLAVDSLEVRTSGGSDVRLNGNARQTTLKSSGGSDLDASRLKSDTAHLYSSGGSDISIGQSGTLVANASGGSDISYSGEPRSMTINKSGGAGVRRSSRD